MSASKMAEPGETPVGALREAIGVILTPAAIHTVPAQRAHFMHGAHGRALWPTGEVSVAAAAGRAGKTLTLVSMILNALAGEAIGDLQPPASDGVAVVYSAEDDVQDYMRVLAAQQEARGWSDSKLARVLQRIRIPDLRGERCRALRTLLTQGPDRLPMATASVDYIIDACRDLRVQVVILETLSKLSEVEENNIGLKRFVAGAERIAEALQCSVVLVHHVSQASLPSLRELDLNASAIRGGTALPDDARQTATIVNLGSRCEPVGGDEDARTRLREMAFPGSTLRDDERVGVYVTLDSSKSARPRPIFLRWVNTQWGPAPLVTQSPAGEVARQSWEQLVQYARGAKAPRVVKKQPRGGRDED